MKTHKTAIAFLFSSTAMGFDVSNMDVVMRGGDPAITELNEGDFPTYRNGACTIRFSRDGNLATQNGFYTGGWDANQNSQCMDCSQDKVMTYKLQRDGNFVARCGNKLDYTTHTNQVIGDYFLAIDDSCILHLFKGTFDCDSTNVEEEIWTNIRHEPLKNGDRLGKGEMIRFDNSTLIMQSSDGNLVLYAGQSSDDTVLWAANQEWDGRPSGFQDYYAKITNDGHLQLVGVDLQGGPDSIYFEKDLSGNLGSGCFKVVYDNVDDDSVAIPCSGARRHLLRGSEDT